MHGESQAHEVREDGCGALLRLDRGVVWWRGDLAGEREAIYSRISICGLSVVWLSCIGFESGIEGGSRAGGSGRTGRYSGL